MPTMIKAILAIKHLSVSGVDKLRSLFIVRWKHLSDVSIAHLKDNRQGLLLASTPQSYTGFENSFEDREQRRSPQNYYLDVSF